ncbi:MAG: serine/threonine-protein kinase, partial [Planctomycetota bacterium]
MNAPSSNDRNQTIIAQCRAALASGDTSTVVRLLGEHPEMADALLPLLQAAADPGSSGEAGGTNQSPSSGSSADQGTVGWSNDSHDRNSSVSDATLTHMPGSSRGSSSDVPFVNSPALGSVVGGFRLVRPLGRGGMGEVFEAEEVATGRRLALKMLSSNLPRNSQTVDRFVNEASLAASLTHPRTTFVYGAGEQDGKFYISMELMPGRTLKDLVEQEGPCPVTEAIDHVIDMLDGLEAAHESGVIHRDLKPSNCFVDAGDRIKIGDFGLAKSLVDGADITQTGMFLGTPQFAAPEQIRHADVDQRTDLFSVGATLYYLLTGTAPYTGDPAAVIAQIVADPPPKVRILRPEVPRTIQGIIVRCINKNPKRRYSSAGELRRALLPFSSRGT